MSEPSLRNTIHRAILRELTPLGQGVNMASLDAQAHNCTVAALRVIHTQRDAIAQAIREAIQQADGPHDAPDIAADAVLATLAGDCLDD